MFCCVFMFFGGQILNVRRAAGSFSVGGYMYSAARTAGVKGEELEISNFWTLFSNKVAYMRDCQKRAASAGTA